METETRGRRLGAGLAVITTICLLYVFGLPHARFNIPMIARAAVILAVVVGLLAWHRRAHWRQLHATVRVCDQCNVVKAAGDQAACVCGGAFIPLGEMKWLEMPPIQETAAPKNRLRPAPAV
ncbi:MAG TPA: hypothetical protein VGO59_15995 [Verrucomicrobiae bacterium]